MNRGHGAGPWDSLLPDDVGLGEFRDDAALANNENRSSRKLLFQFSNEADLNSFEVLELRIWDKENDSFLSVTNVNFTGGADGQTLQLILEFVR